MGYWETDLDGVERFKSYDGEDPSWDDSEDTTPDKPLKSFWGEEVNSPWTRDGAPQKTAIDEVNTIPYSTPEERLENDSLIAGYNRVYSDESLSMAERQIAFEKCQRLIAKIVGTDEVGGSAEILQREMNEKPCEWESRGDYLMPKYSKSGSHGVADWRRGK